MEAANASEASRSQLEAWVLVAWLLKDLGWVLLLTPLAMPAALAGICLEAHVLLRFWAHDSWALRTHQLALLLWLLGNAIWMSAELLFERKDPTSSVYRLPWYHQGGDESYYVTAVHVAQGIFAVAIAALLVLYATHLPKRSAGGGDTTRSGGESAENPQDSGPPEGLAAASSEVREKEPLAFGVVTREVYAQAFVMPWLLKDVCWSMEWLWPAVPFFILTLAMITDVLRRYHLVESLVEVFWVLGNGLWIYAELGAMDKVLGLRLASAALLAAGTALALPLLLGWWGPRLDGALRAFGLLAATTAGDATVSEAMPLRGSKERGAASSGSASG